MTTITVVKRVAPNTNENVKVDATVIEDIGIVKQGTNWYQPFHVGSGLSFGQSFDLKRDAVAFVRILTLDGQLIGPGETGVHPDVDLLMAARTRIIEARDAWRFLSASSTEIPGNPVPQRSGTISVGYDEVAAASIVERLNQKGH